MSLLDFIVGAWKPSESLDPILEEQLNRLRHEASNRPDGKPIRSILVTSAIEGEGKTTVATGLARAFARSLDHSALLVETDLRRPGIDKLFGFESGPGLISHILDAAPLSKVIRSTEIAKLSVVPAGGRLDAAANVISSSYMREFIKRVTTSQEGGPGGEDGAILGKRGSPPPQGYKGRVVVFDAPPVLAAPETLALAQLVDGIVLVVRAESTPRDLVKQAIAALPREKIIGVALNAQPLSRRDRQLLYSYYYAGKAA